MRQLLKGPKPPVLVVNEVEWTTNYVAAYGTLAERSAEKWRHAQIRESLRIETGAKCAYCESYVDDVSFPHVEHIVPKGIRQDLAHTWSNLTSACGRCNTYKGDFYSDSGVFHPYDDDPSSIKFHAGFIDRDFGADRAETTIRRLRLDRPELTRSRNVRIESVRELLERWHRADQPLRDIIGQSIVDDALAGEYSTAVLQYLRQMRFEPPA